MKPRNIKNIEKHLNAGFSSWKNRPLVEITRAKAKAKFLEMTKRSPAQANQAFRELRALWNYAAAEYRNPDDTPIYGENPVQIISAQKLWNDVQPRNSKVPVLVIHGEFHFVTAKAKTLTLRIIESPLLCESDKKSLLAAA